MSIQLTRRSFLRLGLMAGGAVALTSCGVRGDSAAPDEATTLRLPGVDVNFPSPFSYGGGVGYVQASYTYDTLLWKDARGQYQPWLASDFDRSADGTRYRFRLRDGITWHDGEQLTAEDVTFTFDYLAEHVDQLAPQVISVPDLANITAVRAADRLTVELVLAQPDWTFEQFSGLGSVLIMPRHIWSSIPDPGQQRDLDVLVGSGPYRLASHEPGTASYLYTAFDDYFLGRPVVRRIEHIPVDDPLSALLAGELDQAGGVGPGTGLRPQALEPFEGRDEFEIIDAPFGETVTGLYWNLAADAVLADDRFRKACAHAIDRQQLVDLLFDGKATVASAGLVPEANPFHVDVESYDHDVALAERLLDDAGYRRAGPDQARESPDGDPLRFEVLISTSQQLPPVELVVADLAAVGVECTITTVDLPTFLERLDAGELQMSVTTFGGVNTDEQPDGLGKVYASSSRSLQRAQGYENTELDTLLEEQRRTLDIDQRRDLAARMQRIVAADLPMLPLFHPPLTTIVNTTSFDGWYFTPGGIGGLVPSVNNKHAFVTGQQTGGF